MNRLTHCAPAQLLHGSHRIPGVTDPGHNNLVLVNVWRGRFVNLDVLGFEAVVKLGGANADGPARLHRGYGGQASPCPHLPSNRRDRVFWRGREFRRSDRVGNLMLSSRHIVYVVETNEWVISGRDIGLRVGLENRKQGYARDQESVGLFRESE